jgi:hypothetical protein
MCDRFPLARRKAREREQPVAGFIEAVGHGVVFEPPFAQEGIAPGLHLLPCRTVDDIALVVRDFLVQPLRFVREVGCGACGPLFALIGPWS